MESLACRGSLDKHYLLAQKIQSSAQSPIRLDIRIVVAIRSSHEWLLRLVAQTPNTNNLFLLRSIKVPCLLILVRGTLHLPCRHLNSDRRVLSNLSSWSPSIAYRGCEDVRIVLIIDGVFTAGDQQKLRRRQRSPRRYHDGVLCSCALRCRRFRPCEV